MENLKWNQIYEDDDLVIIDDFHKLPSSSQRVKGMVCILAINHGLLTAEINGENLELHHNDILILSSRMRITHMALSDDFSGMIIAIREGHTKLVKVSTSMIKCMFRMSEYPLLHMTAEQEELLGHYKSILQAMVKRNDKTCKKEIVYRVVGAMLYELFNYIFAHNNESEAESMSSTQGERIFKQFIELLVASEMKQRKVQYYADKLCVTPKHLSAMCKQQSDKAALAWINHFIVQDIKYLLINSDWSIKEISNYMGFPNASFFGKYVRKHLGASPSSIRMQSKNS